MFDLSFEGQSATLRMLRPETRNAIPLAGWSELADRSEEAVRQGARLLKLAGLRNGAFCAGADLGDFGPFGTDPSARTAFRLAIRSGLDRLSSLPIPTIAIVEGACFGAGVALAMACDIRMAGPSASFAITPAKLGISYPQEDVFRLVSLVGPGQAARLLFDAQPIDGGEAQRIGLVDRFVPEDLDGEIGQTAAAIVANDGESLRVLKRGIALAAAGRASDPEQDRLFDLMLGGEALQARLASHRGRPR